MVISATLTATDCTYLAKSIVFDNDKLRISFQRTVRVPDGHGRTRRLPDLGHLPLFSVDQYAGSLPAQVAQKGGVFIPLYRELMPARMLSRVSTEAELAQSKTQHGSDLNTTVTRNTAAPRHSTIISSESMPPESMRYPANPAPPPPLVGETTSKCPASGGLRGFSSDQTSIASSLHPPLIPKRPLQDRWLPWNA